MEIFMKQTVTIDENVTIDCYSLDANSKRPTVIICPGGGYGYHSVREAEPVALKFLSHGFNAIVLFYRVADKAKFPNPMVDLAKVVELLNSKNAPFKNTGRFISVGFSAGGNLVLEYNSHWKKICKKYFPHQKDISIFKSELTVCGYTPVTFDMDDLDKIDERFADDVFYFKNSNHILEIALSKDRRLSEGINYAVFGSQKVDKSIMQEYDILTNSDFQNMSPTFIFATGGDIIVNNKDIFKLAIEFENHRVPFELHFFQWGNHGLSLGDAFTANTAEQIDLHYAKWFDLCIEWIKRQIE